jgi:hypothetical protein
MTKYVAINREYIMGRWTGLSNLYWPVEIWKTWKGGAMQPWRVNDC